MTTKAPAAIERLSPGDLTELACDVGPVPMQVAAILVLEGVSVLEPSAVVEAIAERISTVRRLRQRLMRTPLGCGRPVWVDDPHFDICQHVHCVQCPAPGDDEAVLAVAAQAATHRLADDRPLWSATFVTGVTGGRAALVVVSHHVLADGIAGLTVLARLVDGAVANGYPDFPRPAPSRRQLFAEATSSRLRAVAALPSGLWRLRAAVAELQPAGVPSAPNCSLSRPTGSRRRLAVARADLAAARDVAHANGGTVNDVVLAAVAGALKALLRHRGESVDRLIVSVPASARSTTSATQLGNQVGVIPVAVPTGGDPLQRLQSIARITRTRKRAQRGASAALLGPAFRTLGRLGLVGWFINRQRLVTTFVTNLRGPDNRLSFLGAPITGIYPVAVVHGNVTVAFAALSYAGTLAVTVIADPDRCPDLPVLARYLQCELDTLTTGQTRPS